MPKIIRDIKQLDDEWFRLRIGSIGGSSIKRLMTGGKGKTRDALKYELVNEIREQKKHTHYVSAAMEEGSRREPESRAKFCMITGFDVEEIAMIKGDIDRTHCSPDGLVSDGTGLELKNPIYTTQVRYLDKECLPSEHEYQVQYGMWLTGYKRWWFFSYHPKLKSLLLEVERDEEQIKAIEKAVVTFIAELNRLVEKMG